MTQKDHQPRGTVPSRGRPLILILGLLVAAWLAFLAGRWRVSHLDWTGYDPDPDISESIYNDARCARTYLPFVTAAVALDLAAIGVLIWGRGRRHWTLSALAIGLILVSLAWHGLTLVWAGFFATSVQ